MTDDSATPASGEEFDADSATATLTQDVPTLQAQVESLTGELEAARTDFLRARADFQNLKRRTEEEREGLKAYLI